ncbi:MAG TPA: zf-HC2 domain-containing protein [Gaiellaceae bacterium]|nr:zf-HC2 domain-containing protein [Gaiellaceae bacterium]
MNGDCERARQWASIELDGELSTFERVLLRAHLAHCPPCREFGAETTGLTHALRAAPLEQLEQPIEIGRMRRGLRLRLAPAAAAMAMLFVGIGSILATSAVRSVGTNHTRTAPVTAELGGIQAMNLSTSTALEHLNAFQQIRVSTANRSLRGGPVLQER